MFLRAAGHLNLGSVGLNLSHPDKQGWSTGFMAIPVLSARDLNRKTETIITVEVRWERKATKQHCMVNKMQGHTESQTIALGSLCLAKTSLRKHSWCYTLNNRWETASNRAVPHRGQSASKGQENSAGFAQPSCQPWGRLNSLR